jgi:aryl sulfotransferase
MQRIVGMLVFLSPEPRPLDALSPWLDSRRDPVERAVQELEAQAHRRFIKSHLPLGCLPLYEEVRIIHVARDGRDACASFFNHVHAYTAEALARLDRIGAEDAAIGRRFPRPAADFRTFYLDWMAASPAEGPAPGLDFFAFEQSYWAERARPNLLLVHHNDLLSDLEGEMRRIAAFLSIECPPNLMQRLVEAAAFEAMRRDGDQLLPNAHRGFEGGADRFLFKGANGRWRGLLTADDAALYGAKVSAGLTADCAQWVEAGRLQAGIP